MPGGNAQGQRMTMSTLAARLIEGDRFRPNPGRQDAADRFAMGQSPRATDRQAR
jgi:hypothetical protein